MNYQIEVPLEKVIGLRFKKLRLKKNYTQQGLADDMGLSRYQVVQIELGNFALKVKTLELFCSYFNVKSREILPF